MAQGVKKWSEAAIARLQKDGRGEGEGAAYLPWIRALDGSSLGKVTRVPGLRIQRTHHLLSGLELSALFLFEYADGVTDIREQFPLDRSRSMELAAAAGIRHPIYLGTRVPVVMTTDFLVSFARGGVRWDEAFDVKPANKLDDLRVIEKLEIARRYWETRKIPYHLVLDTALPKLLINNLERLRPYSGRLTPENSELDIKQQLSLMPRFLRELAHADATQSLYDFAESFGLRNHLDQSNSITLLMCLIADRHLRMDLHCHDIPRAPVSCIQNLAHMLPEPRKVEVRA